jgi:hypothetical protein
MKTVKKQFELSEKKNIFTAPQQVVLSDLAILRCNE